MIARPPILRARAAHAAAHAGHSGRLSRAVGRPPPALVLPRPAGGRTAVTHEHRLHLQHVIHMTLRSQLRPETMRLLTRLTRLTETRAQPPHPSASRPAVLVLTLAGSKDQSGGPAAGLWRLRPRHGVMLAYRRAPVRASGAEMQRQIQKITRHVQSRVVADVSQNVPWRGELRQALRSPELVRLLTDQVARAIDRRGSVEAYRRGL